MLGNYTEKEKLIFYFKPNYFTKEIFCLPPRKSAPAVSVLREDTFSMPAQPAFAQAVVCLCLLLTDVLKGLPGENDVTDVV